MVDTDLEEDKVWVVYDAGPKTVRCPIVFLPPASGTADVFFKQLLALSSAGYRVMSVNSVIIVLLYCFIKTEELLSDYMLCYSRTKKPFFTLLDFDVFFQVPILFYDILVYFPSIFY